MLRRLVLNVKTQSLKTFFEQSRILKPLKFSDDKNSAGFHSALVIFRRPETTVLPNGLSS